MRWEDCFSEICKSLFRIKVKCSSGTYLGTGFVVSKFKKPEKLDFVLATAKHVIAKVPENENVYWSIEKFNATGNKIEEFVFQTNVEVTGKSVIRSHKDFDIAAVCIP
jgi:hypothetical protein